jgi:hypothetical protein
LPPVVGSPTALNACPVTCAVGMRESEKLRLTTSCERPIVTNRASPGFCVPGSIHVGSWGHPGPHLANGRTNDVLTGRHAEYAIPSKVVRQS